MFTGRWARDGHLLRRQTPYRQTSPLRFRQIVSKPNRTPTQCASHEPSLGLEQLLDSTPVSLRGGDHQGHSGLAQVSLNLTYLVG